MAVYNTSYMNDATNIVDLFTGTGAAIAATNEYLIGTLIVLVFFLIVLSLSSKYDFIQILIVDSFVTTVVASLLLAVGMVNTVVVIAPFVLFVFSLVFYGFSK